MASAPTIYSPTPNFRSIAGVRNRTGKLCTVLGKRFIVAVIKNSLELVVIENISSVEDTAAKQWDLFKSRVSSELCPKFVVNEGSKPISLHELNDGTEVQFDGVKNSNLGNYEAVLIWTGSKKPTVYVEPLLDTYVLIRIFKRVPVNIKAMLTDHGFLIFNNVSVKFYKNCAKLIIGGKRILNWDSETVIKNCTKFSADLYEFRNGSLSDTSKYVCSYLMLNDGTDFQSKPLFKYNTLYSFDACDNISMKKSYGITTYCTESARLVLSQSKNEIEITVSEKNICFACPVTNDLKKSLGVLQKKQAEITSEVLLQEIYKESENHYWRLYVILNNGDEDSLNILLKTFITANSFQRGGNFVTESVGETSHLKGKNYEFCISELKSDVRINKSDSRIGRSSTPNTLKVISPNLELGTSKNSKGCWIHSSIISKPTENSEETILPNRCFLENEKDVDITPVHNWKNYFLQEKLYNTARNKNRKNLSITNSDFLNQFIKPSADTDVLKSLYNFGSLPSQNRTSSMNCEVVPSFLFDKDGTIVILDGDVYLSSLILEQRVMIKILVKKNFSLRFLDNIMPPVFWEDGRPDPLVKLTHGAQVKFDAARVPDTTCYQAIIIWTGRKPTFVPFVRHNTFILVKEFPNTPVKFKMSDDGTKNLEFLDEESNQYCRFLKEKWPNIKFREDKPLRGHIYKIIEFQNNNPVINYVCTKLFHSHESQKSCKFINLEYGQLYSKEEDFLESSNEHNVEGLYLDVPFKLRQRESAVEIQFVISGDRFTLSTAFSDQYLQQLYCPYKCERKGVMHMYKLSDPISYRVLVLHITDSELLTAVAPSLSKVMKEDTVNRRMCFCMITDNGIIDQLVVCYPDKDIWKVRTSSPEIDDIYALQKNETKVFNHIDSDDYTERSGKQRLSDVPESHKYYLKSTDEICLKNATESVVSPQSCSQFQTCGAGRAANTNDRADLVLETPSLTFIDDSAFVFYMKFWDKSKGSHSACPTALVRMQRVIQGLRNFSGEVPKLKLSYSNVILNWPGVLRSGMKQTSSVINFIVNSKAVTAYPASEGFLQYGNKCVILTKLDKPKDIKLDAYYDKQKQRYKITALWIGKKSKAFQVSKSEDIFRDVIGQYLGSSNNKFKLKCRFEHGFDNITTYNTERIFDENGVKKLKDLAVGSPVLVHLRRSTASRKEMWEIVMLIELTDAIIKDFFKLDGQTICDASPKILGKSSSQLNIRKNQIAEITKIWTELATVRFIILFGKITSTQTDYLEVECELNEKQNSFIVPKEIFLDSPTSTVINCDVCILAIPQSHLLSPNFIIGWYRRLYVNCYILSDHTHEHKTGNIFNLKSTVKDEFCLSYMAKNVKRIMNHPAHSLYYLVQNRSKTSVDQTVTKEILLVSDNRLLVMTTMMILSKEFENKINHQTLQSLKNCQ